MEISEELIERFFKNECTREEADKVAQYLEEHPELMDEHFSAEEFEATTPTGLTSEQEVEQWEALQKKIKQRTIKKNLGRLAIAAGLAGIILLATLWNQHATPPQPIIAHTQENSTTIDSSWELIANTTNETTTHTLADGTEIRLKPGSSIRFNSRQWQRRRDIDLKGEAVFYVAKDKARPFTVYCDEVSVQALGTVFSVYQPQKADSMRVKLFEGKVLVRKQRQARGIDTADRITPVIMKPGQALVFAPDNDAVYVYQFLKSAPEKLATKKMEEEDNDVAPNGWIEFNNQPLGDLFTSLEVLYNVEIEFNRADVTEIYFMGRFESYDTIEGILKIISQLNDLRVVKTGARSYHVSKD
ncbi:MAG TPA: FecR domain-containing protein [Phnomibacter sp.]|nr:FecR domain-containing protein [Phnomibacter sp.]